MKPRYQFDLSALMRLYETNYAKLVRLMPPEPEVGARCSYAIQGQVFHLTNLENTTYTTLLSIDLEDSVPEYLKPKLVVRLYHDARVAEVCTSQQISRIKPRYDYPNAKMHQKMHQKNEKQQINAFLADWLMHCLTNGTMIA